MPAESKQSPCSWLLPPRRGKAGRAAGGWGPLPEFRDGHVVSSSRRRFHETEPNHCPMNEHDTSTTNKCMVRALGGYPTETRTCQADETQPHASRGQALEPNTKTPARGLQVHCARLRRARGPTLTPASKLASVHSGSDVSTSSLDSSSTSTARHANSSSKSMAPSIDTSRARTPGEQESSKPVASTSLGSLRRPSSMKPKRSFCRWNARFTIDDSSVALANRPHPPAARPAFPRLGGRSPLSRHPPFWWQALLPFVKQNQGVTLPARRFAPDRGRCSQRRTCSPPCIQG